MVLGSDIVETFWSAEGRHLYIQGVFQIKVTYYFSTHGCRFWVSLEAAALDDEAPFAAAAAAAAARTLLSKKLDMRI